MARCPTAVTAHYAHRVKRDETCRLKPSHARVELLKRIKWKKELNLTRSLLLLHCDKNKQALPRPCAHAHRLILKRRISEVIN